MAELLARLERDLLRVPGVQSARVVGDDFPSEIHVVASSRRSPKQVVRDVQSLSAARFGIQIDHRIVSVVQLDEERPPPSPPPPPPPTLDMRSAEITSENKTTESAPSKKARRLVLERLIQASKGESGWVRVSLRWPDGSTTEGVGGAGSSRDARARGAAQALLQALQPALAGMGSKLDVDQLLLQRLGSNDTVLIRAVLYERGKATPLVGSALIYDDVASASVRALLQAINRKLRLNQRVSA